MKKHEPQTTNGKEKPGKPIKATVGVVDRIDHRVLSEYILKRARDLWERDKGGQLVADTSRGEFMARFTPKNEDFFTFEIPNFVEITGRRCSMRRLISSAVFSWWNDRVDVVSAMSKWIEGK